MDRRMGVSGFSGHGGEGKKSHFLAVNQNQFVQPVSSRLTG